MKIFLIIFDLLTAAWGMLVIAKTTQRGFGFFATAVAYEASMILSAASILSEVVK